MGRGSGRWLGIGCRSRLGGGHHNFVVAGPGRRIVTALQPPDALGQFRQQTLLPPQGSPQRAIIGYKPDGDNQDNREDRE